MSTLNVDKVDPSSGTALELGTSGDTITVPTGAGLTVTDEVKTNKVSPATGTAFALGDSGDTFTVPSGATIVNSGTATGFGGGKILQAVSYTGNAVRTASSSTTYTATTTSIAITPAATTSKILIFFGGTSTFDSGNGYFTVFRDIGGGGFSNLAGFSGLYYGSTGDWVPGYGYMEDSPATTSECTYTVYLKQTGGGTAYWGTESSVSATTLPTNGQSLVCFELGA